MLAHARPGTYRLTITQLHIAHQFGAVKQGALAVPVQRTVKLRLRHSKARTLVATYGSIINPGVRSLSSDAVAGVTGDPGDPTAIVLSGHHAFADSAVISIAPGGALPRGLLADVNSVSYTTGQTTVGVNSVPFYEVAPNLTFDIPLDDASQIATARAASCGGTSGLTPYRRISNVSFAGGWNTVKVIGIPIKVGVQAKVHFTVSAGVDATASVGVSCSFTASFSASGMAGPVPVTAAIDGTIGASLSAGATLNADGSVQVDAGAKTAGVPPGMLVLPDVAFSNPKFTFTAKTFATATASIGVNARVGIGNDSIASATVGIGAALTFTGSPGACSFDASFGQFFAEGKLLGFAVQTPKTPALFSKNLWHNACAASQTNPGPGTGSTPGGGSTPGAGGSPPSGGGSTPIGAPPAGSGQTWAETTGGAANTWTNPANAGGTQGPTIPANSTVQIACKLPGFRVADGNTWWYKVASSPWANSYYVSADAFYNNGSTSGPLKGTPFVDPAVADCPGTAPPPLPPPPPAWAETAGGVAHTWTNYTNAGGTQGPSIASNQTVAISCKITGFQVADGDTWWYRIASSPWNNAYYVSADAFYNNGATSGSLHGTPFVDPAVANC